MSENFPATSTPIVIIPETETLNGTSQILVQIEDLTPGQYIVTMSRTEDQLNIWNIRGEKLGTFLPFSLAGNIDPGYSLLAYVSSTVTSSAMHFFGSDYALYDLDSNSVIPIDMPEVEWGVGFGGAWSPDGDFIVINTLNEGIYPRLGLVTVASLQFEDIELWDGEARAPDWSPDGEFIAFSSSYFSEGNLLSSIFLLDTVCLSSLSSCSENVKRVFFDEEYSYYAPSWAPDSIHLVFSCADGEEHSTNLCIGNIDTGEIVTIDNTNTIYDEPEWGPNGDWIVSSTDRNTYVVRPDGSEARLIVENEGFLFWISIPDND
jgi:hypothetical protein